MLAPALPEPATASADVATPWVPPTSASSSAPTAPRRASWGRFLPFLGPLLLFIAWDFVVRFGFIKAILLPSPADTLGA